MNELEGLVAAVLAADPDDDLVRLVLADWYEENGQGDRAFTIRDACAAARLRHTHSHGHPGGCRKCKLNRKVGRWIQGEGKGLFRDMFGISFGQAGGAIRNGVEWLAYGPGRSGYAMQFDRGLVSEVACPVAVWVGGECETCRGVDAGCPRCSGWAAVRGGGSIHGIGPRVVAEHPVARFVPSDMPAPLQLTGGPHIGYHFWVLRDLPEEIHPHIPNSGVFTDPLVNVDEAQRAMSRAFLAWARANSVENSSNEDDR